MAEHPIGQQEILNRVYKGPNKTGDNVDGLVNLTYAWDGANWVRQTAGAGSGGTQYTDGNAVPTHPIGNALVTDVGGTWKEVSPTNPLPISGSFSATTTNANNTYGSVSGVSVSGTGTIVNIASSTAGYKIAGFTATGNADGYIFVQLNGTTILSGNITNTERNLVIILPNPIPISTGTVIDFKVTNNGQGSAAYEGTLLGI